MHPNVFNTDAMARYESTCLQHKCYETPWNQMSSKHMLWHTMNPNVFTTHIMAHHESKCLQNTCYGTLWIHNRPRAFILKQLKATQAEAASAFLRVFTVRACNGIAQMQMHLVLSSCFMAKSHFKSECQLPQFKPVLVPPSGEQSENTGPSLLHMHCVFSRLKSQKTTSKYSTWHTAHQPQTCTMFRPTLYEATAHKKRKPPPFPSSPSPPPPRPLPPPLPLPSSPSPDRTAPSSLLMW